MGSKSYINAISYYLPEKILTNDMLDIEFPEWKVHEIAKTTGVYTRHISDENEISSDLAFKAAQKLFSEQGISSEIIDFIIFCTQSADYLTPTTACILQDRLGLSVNCGAIDINQGCTGFVYGLSLAKSLVETGLATNVLLLTAETITKYINKKDRSSRLLFGDGASASLISNKPDGMKAVIGDFVFGTNGKGYKNIMLPFGGARNPISKATSDEFSDEYGNIRTNANFYINGDSVFLFSVKTAPALVREILKKSKLSIDEINLFIFHQANKLITDTVAKKLNLSEGKYFECLKDFGNTVSSTIPISLKNAFQQNRIKKGNKVLLAAFGVGYSWASTIITF